MSHSYNNDAVQRAYRTLGWHGCRPALAAVSGIKGTVHSEQTQGGDSTVRVVRFKIR